MAATTVNMILKKNAAAQKAAQEDPRAHAENLEQIRRANVDKLLEEEQRRAAAAARHPVLRIFSAVMDFLNGMFFQTVIYFAFVVIFQLLVGTMRIREEFYLYDPSRAKCSHASINSAPFVFASL